MLVTPPPPVILDPDALPTPPALERAREKLAARASAAVVDHAGRHVSIEAKKLSTDERDAGAVLTTPEDVERPRTRGDCTGSGAARPCPFVSCSHHLYLDVNPETGAIKLNFPHLEVWEMAETCSLDVADRGGVTLEEVGAILNLTRERVRQIEVAGLVQIRKAGGDELGLAPERA